METSEVTKYINTNMHVLVPALWILGYVFKTLESVKDTYIPMLLIYFGIFMASGIQGFNMNTIIQGILVAGAAILIHQGYKQIKDKTKGDKNV